MYGFIDLIKRRLGTQYAIHMLYKHIKTHDVKSSLNQVDSNGVNKELIYKYKLLIYTRVLSCFSEVIMRIYKLLIRCSKSQNENLIYDGLLILSYKMDNLYKKSLDYFHMANYIENKNVCHSPLNLYMDIMLSIYRTYPRLFNKKVAFSDFKIMILVIIRILLVFIFIFYLLFAYYYYLGVLGFYPSILIVACINLFLFFKQNKFVEIAGIVVGCYLVCLCLTYSNWSVFIIWSVGLCICEIIDIVKQYYKRIKVFKLIEYQRENSFEFILCDDGLVDLKENLLELNRIWVCGSTFMGRVNISFLSVWVLAAWMIIYMNYIT